MYEVVSFGNCCDTVSTTLSLQDSQSHEFKFLLQPSNTLGPV